METLQTLQNRTARVIANANDEDVDRVKSLKHLDWFNVRQLVELETVSLMYKIENGLASTHMKEMFVKTSDIHTYSTRSATNKGRDGFCMRTGGPTKVRFKNLWTKF